MTATMEDSGAVRGFEEKRLQQKGAKKHNGEQYQKKRKALESK